MNDASKVTAIVATPQVSVPAFAMPEPELLAALESTCYPGAALPSIKLVVNVCRAQHLDPFQKPYHIVPMNVRKPKSDQYEWRDVVMPGVGLYRTQAARTGAFAGIDEGNFGPTVVGEFGNKKVPHPEWCSVTVYRMVAGSRVAFSSGKVYWLESYATIKRDSDVPNAMWSKRPFGQLEKCAEALALRRAFPEVGAAPTADEMAGKVIDNETGEILVDSQKTDVEPPPGKADRLKDRLAKAKEKPPIDAEPARDPALLEEVKNGFGDASTVDRLIEIADLARGLKHPDDRAEANAAYKEAKMRVDSPQRQTETAESGGVATSTTTEGEKK